MTEGSSENCTHDDEALSATLPRVPIAPASGRPGNGQHPYAAYRRGVFTLLSGSGAAQAIPILAIPLLTRLYRPQDFGGSAAIASMSAIVSVTVTSHYVHAIMLERKRRDAMNILAVCLIVSVVITAITFAAVLIFAVPIAAIIGLSEDVTWLRIVPIMVLLNGVSGALSVWLSRQGAYGRLAVNRVLQLGITTAIQIAAGFHGGGMGKLLIGATLGSAVSTGLLLVQCRRDDPDYLKLISSRRLRYLLSSRRRFLLYALPADITNVFTNQAPVMLLSSFAGPTAVGHYALSQRALGLPMGLVGSSITEVFKREAVREWHESGRCRRVFTSTLKLLAALAIGPTLTILFLGPRIFSLVLGENWTQAGRYAQVLSVMFFLRFVSSPLSYVYYIASRQKEDLVLHVYMGISTILIMYESYQMWHDTLITVACFAGNYCIIYLIYLMRSFHFAARGNAQESF